jgi:hypothetical protein
MKYFTLIFVMLVSIFLLFACGSSNDLSGEYVCTKHITDDMVGELSLDFQKDGTVIMKPLNREGSYEVNGDTVSLDVGFELTFTKEGNTLSSSDGSVVYEKK